MDRGAARGILSDMSAAPQEAVAEVELSQGSAGSPADAAPMPADAAPPAPAPPKVETVSIWGVDVPVSEIVTLFDPKCPDRCVDGVLKVMRPMPKPFKGTMPVRELCACGVRRYAEAHPPEVSGGLSAAARAALAPDGTTAAESAESPGRAKLGRLREQLARETTRLMAARAVAGDKTTALEAERAGLERAAAALDVGTRARMDRRVLATVRKEECARAIGRIARELVELDAEDEAAALAIAPSVARARDIDAALARTRAASEPVERPILAAIEKLERRIATVVAYHPELVS